MSNKDYEATFIRVARDVILQAAGLYEAPEYWVIKFFKCNIKCSSNHFHRLHCHLLLTANMHLHRSSTTLV